MSKALVKKIRKSDKLKQSKMAYLLYNGSTSIPSLQVERRSENEKKAMNEWTRDRVIYL